MQFSQKRLKETTSIALNAYLLNRAKELVEKGEFGSVSDVISTALSEFYANYDSRKKQKEQEKQLEGNPELTRKVVIE